VNSSTISPETARHVAQLTRELDAARKRADVAEEQLRRVHAAVRAFKQRQLAARQAAVTTAQAKVPVEVATGLYQSWPAADPSLDDRFQDFLDGQVEEDRARKWMLDED